MQEGRGDGDRRIILLRSSLCKNFMESQFNSDILQLIKVCTSIVSVLHVFFFFLGQTKMCFQFLIINIPLNYNLHSKFSVILILPCKVYMSFGFKHFICTRHLNRYWYFFKIYWIKYQVVLAYICHIRNFMVFWLVL